MSKIEVLHIDGQFFAPLTNFTDFTEFRFHPAQKKNQTSAHQKNTIAFT